MDKGFLSAIMIIITQGYFSQLSVPNGTVGTTTDPSTRNVGIGTTNPTQKLDVKNGSILVGNDDLSGGALYFGNPSHGLVRAGNVLRMYVAGWEESGLSFGHQGENGYQEHLRISNEGNASFHNNVGIGTTSPTQKLDVKNGSILVGNDDLSGGALYFGNPSHGLIRTGNVMRMYTAGWEESGLSFGHQGENGYQEHLRISNEGNASFQGKVEAKEIKVTTTPTADFVFEEGYHLRKLEEVEKHIKEKKHLPEIASGEEMKREGLDLGNFQIKLLQKIEELTLYSIEQNKQLYLQQEALRKLKEENKVLKAQKEKIEYLEKEIKKIKSKSSRDKN